MSTSLMWAASTASRRCPISSQRARARSHLSTAERCVPASLFFALPGPHCAWARVCCRGGPAPRRERGAVGARRPSVAPRSLPATVIRGGDTGAQGTGRPHLPIDSSIGPHRSCASTGITGNQWQDHVRLSAGSVSGAAWDRRAAYIGTIGWGPYCVARAAHPHHARVWSRCIAKLARPLRAFRRCARWRMEVSSQALDQDRRRRACDCISAAFTNLRPRSLGLSRDHGGLRCCQGRGCSMLPISKHIVVNVGDALRPRNLRASLPDGCP